MKDVQEPEALVIDLRVSDFKQIPGFNCVLSVTEDEHTYNSLCSEDPRLMRGPSTRSSPSYLLTF